MPTKKAVKKAAASSTATKKGGTKKATSKKSTAKTAGKQSAKKQSTSKKKAARTRSTPGIAVKAGKAVGGALGRMAGSATNVVKGAVTSLSDVTGIGQGDEQEKKRNKK